MKDQSIQELIDLYNSGKLDIVEKKIVELIKKNPKSFVLYNLFGTILVDKKNFNQALVNYKKSLEINPNYAEGHNNLGVAFYKLRKFNESIDSYQRAIKIKPNFSKAHNNLGLAYKELEKFTESINNYQKAIKINPKYAEAYNNLGNVYNSNQKIDDAILNYKKAIKLNANFPEAYSNLGNLLKEIGEVAEAKKYENKLLSLRPNDIEYKINVILSISPIVSSIEEINYCRNEYKKGLDLLKEYQYLSEKPGDTIKTSSFHLGYHAKDNLELMKNTSELFRKIIPNLNYISKNIDKHKKQKKN